jgi:hypothetical protein
MIDGTLIHHLSYLHVTSVHMQEIRITIRDMQNYIFPIKRDKILINLILNFIIFYTIDVIKAHVMNFQTHAINVVT